MLVSHITLIIMDVYCPRRLHISEVARPRHTFNHPRISYHLEYHLTNHLYPGKMDFMFFLLLLQVCGTSAIRREGSDVRTFTQTLGSRQQSTHLTPQGCLRINICFWFFGPWPNLDLEMHDGQPSCPWIR